VITTLSHSSAHSCLRRRRRRILVPCFANAKPLPETGNNYLGSECDHLPPAGNIIRPYLGDVAKLIRRRPISLKRDNHPPTLLSVRVTYEHWWVFNPSQKTTHDKRMTKNHGQKHGTACACICNQLAAHRSAHRIPCSYLSGFFFKTVASLRSATGFLSLFFSISIFIFIFVFYTVASLRYATRSPPCSPTAGVPRRSSRHALETPNTKLNRIG